jgi:hypothetical protein
MKKIEGILVVKSFGYFSMMMLGASIAGAEINEATHVELGTALTVFGLAFGAWAVVLGYVMAVVRKELGELRVFVREEAERRRTADERAHEDRLKIERRITEVEAVNRYRYNGDA